MQEIKSGKMFRYVQCDLKVPEHLKTFFANSPPNFQNAVVSRNDIGDLMKEYAEKEGIMPQPRRMLISSLQLKVETIITFLLLYYLHLGLECKKNHQFVQNTPKKCFSSSVQSAVSARRQGDENPKASLVAEIMKFLANSSFGYQIMDRSRHTVTKSLIIEKTHSAKIIKMFKRLNHITDPLYALFFLSELNGTSYLLNIALITLLRMQPAIFFPERVLKFTRKMIRERETGLFKEEFRCAELLCVCSKTYCRHDKQTNKYMFSSKRLKKRTLENCGDGPMSNVRKLLDESVNVTSTKRGF